MFLAYGIEYTPFLCHIGLPAAGCCKNLDLDRRKSFELLGYLTANLPNLLTAVTYAYHSRSC